MNKRLLLITLLTFNTILNAQTSSSGDFEEPKNQFKIKIDTKEIIVTEGEFFDLENTKNKKISIELLNYKKFEPGKISFDYPTSYAFEYEFDAGFKNWTFDGSNVVIQYYEIEADVTIDDLIDGMIKNFGKKNCKLEDTKIILGNYNLSGKRINVSLLEQKLSIDFYEIQLNDGIKRYLGLQDSKDENGLNSAELSSTLELINKSFSILNN